MIGLESVMLGTVKHSVEAITPVTLAYLLLETCDRLRQRGMVNGGTTYHFPLTRRHIADATGLSHMHLIRVLKEMREKRLALIDRAALIVYDWEKLAERAEYIPVGAVGRRAIL
jgi:hypothetical protein